MRRLSLFPVLLFATLLFTITSCANLNSGLGIRESQSARVNLEINPADRLFQSSLDLEQGNCWKSRPNSGGWNLKGCGGFVNIGKGSAVSLAENEISHSGKKSLKITYSKNEDLGGAEVKIPPSNHIFTRYYQYYSKDFDFGFGVKTHRIRSFDPTREINNFDAVGVTWAQSNKSVETDMTGINNMRLFSHNYNGGFKDWGGHYANFGFERERWYCVEHELKLNDVGTGNGETRAWIDGVLKVEAIGLEIRNNENHKLDFVMFGGWYSNGARAKNPQIHPNQSSIRYLDDLVISASRIGCN